MINGRYDIAITYGMRKRWNLIAKQTQGVNSHFVEKMFAHNSRTHALDTTYLKPRIEQLFAEYKKFYSELYISKEYRLKIELRKKDKMIDENQEIVDDDGIFAEPVVREDIDYDKEEKVTTIALNEFLDGKIDWKKSDESIEK